MRATAAVILAAGQGTRMKSDLPKVLHEIDGRPMVAYVVETVRRAGIARAIAVVGYQAESVKRALATAGVEFVLQREQLGTGHAVLQCAAVLGAFAGTVVVLSGDVPGLRAETLRDFISHHHDCGASATVLTARVGDPTGYGRVVRGPDGALERIVEHKDADDGVRAIDEVNSGLYCFERAPLFEALGRTDRANAQNEYYLTDVIQKMRSRGLPVGAYCVGDEREVAGVNTLGELETISRFIRDGRR